MRAKDWLTVDEARKRMGYDPETGKLTWKLLRNKKRIGEEACCLDVHGYVQVNVAGTLCKGHRLAWLLHYGVWPELHIDHINGKRHDNRIANLREVSGTINTQNKRVPMPSNKTGYLGVTFSGANGYASSIQSNGKKHYLGSFTDPEKAHDAYIAAKRRLHEGCTL